MAKQAMDTFVAVLSDGTERTIRRGDVLPDAHAVVKHAPGLFVDFDTQDEKPAPKARRAG